MSSFPINVESDSTEAVTFCEMELVFWTQGQNRTEQMDRQTLKLK